MTGKEKYEIYKKWCRDHNLPAFVPSNNECFMCHKPVFKDGDEGPDADEYVTGCPNCHWSFCD